jgi:hypothetical protein
MKDTSSTDLPVIGWHWNPAVAIASPPGIGCFKAGKEYDHGGISLEELVVPRIIVRSAGGSAEIAKITSVKWVGLRCRVTVEGGVPGLKVDLRGRVAEAKSKVEGGKPKEVSEDGTASLAVENPEDEGTAAHVVLLSNDQATVLDSQLTTIGGGA